MTHFHSHEPIGLVNFSSNRYYTANCLFCPEPKVPHHPFEPKGGSPSNPHENKWDEIFVKTKGGAGGIGTKQKAEDKAAHELEKEAEEDFKRHDKVKDAPPPPKPVAELSNPVWGADQGALNGKITISVQGTLPPEISHITRVTFTVFSTVQGVKPERVDTQDGHIRDGKASAEVTLWAPQAKDEDGKPVQKCEYYFTAKHRDSNELKSDPLKAGAKQKPDESDDARPLKRGTRGEDVLSWQNFLNDLHQRPAFSNVVPSIEVDGIFGIHTADASAKFQSRVGLDPTGIVDTKTRDAAKPYGLSRVKPKSGSQTKPPPTANGKTDYPLIPKSAPLPPPPAPPGPLGSDLKTSWKRLRAEGWRNDAAVKNGLSNSNAVLQSAADGSGDYVYDEYRVDAISMPPGLSAELFLIELAKNLNGAVKNEDFDNINYFTRRLCGPPMVGEIIDIDIAGPENGSVILGEIGDSYFIYQTIECKPYDSHPENGSREFGFQQEGGKVTFYTRGVSRPAYYITRKLGSIPQNRSWTALMQGVSKQINALGGKSHFSSFASIKEERPD